MKKALIVLCISSLIPRVSFGLDEAAEVEQAVTATREFAGALKSELMAAMQSGGAVEAIEICNSQAPVISTRVSLADNLNLTRVSLRNRNPDNAPNGWQTKVLINLENRLQAGERIDALTWHEMAQTGKGQEFRYMKAIPTGQLCLSCHGSNLAPAVAKKLAELYPNDKATGYSIGDLRGAFVVTHSLD